MRSKLLRPLTPSQHVWQSQIELPAVGRKQKDHIGFGDTAALLLDADHVVHNGRCTYHGEAALAFDLQSLSNGFVRHSRAPRMQDDRTKPLSQSRITLTVLRPRNRLIVIADQNY